MKILKNVILDFLQKRWLLLLTITIYLIIWLIPLVDRISFIPDWLNLTKINPQNYFSIIIKAISTIFGILMAVVLITVQFYKEKLTGNKFENPLENGIIRNSIYNSINIIGLSFLSYIHIESFENSSNLTIGYFLGLTFTIYIYSVYPVLLNLIGKSSKIKKNLELIKNINFNSFEEIHQTPSSFEITEDNPIKLLQKEFKEYLISDNTHAYQTINAEFLKLAFKEIGDGQNRDKCESVISSLVWFWKESLKTALRNQNTDYFELVWKNIKEAYVYFALKKAPLLHINGLYFFILFELKKLHILLNNSLPLSVALDTIETSFKTNLHNNCPNQESLKRLKRIYEGGEFEATASNVSFQWDAMNQLHSLFDTIRNIAIETSDRDLFMDTNRRAQDICYDIYSSEFNSKLGSHQRGQLILRVLTSSFYSSQKALESELFETTIDCFKIPENFLSRRIEQKDINIKDLRVIITHLADYLIKAHKENKLETESYFGELHDFYMIAVHSIRFYQTNDLAKESIDYIVKVLSKLKTISEDNLNPQTNNSYLNLKKSVEHIILIAKDVEGFNESTKPLKKWIQISESFKDVSENKEFGIVKWSKSKNKSKAKSKKE